MYDLRKIMKPITDHEYLTCSIWHGKTLRLPEIRKLKVLRVSVVADLLDSTSEVPSKETIEQTRNVNLNFLE